MYIMYKILSSSSNSGNEYAGLTGRIVINAEDLASKIAEYLDRNNIGNYQVVAKLSAIKLEYSRQQSYPSRREKEYLSILFVEESFFDAVQKFNSENQVCYTQDLNALNPDNIAEFNETYGLGDANRLEKMIVVRQFICYKQKGTMSA